MEVEVARPLPQKKDSSSQEVLGTPPLPLQGLDEAIQQTSSFVPLKEFQKQGIKNLKVISQRGLEELINQAVEWELARRLDKERESRMVLEGEVSRLRGELEALKRAGPEPDLPLSGAKGRFRAGGKATPLSPGSPKPALERSAGANIPSGGFFGNILKENLNLRGINQKASGV
ncbi:MAG TPA: hypothetical protein ACFYEA_09700 [Candidatus Tripitaka californicus]|uniref:hypothetical protein n=1 Tax=Candidatus Tripitaka californicus TaxID=3367616 RepID=UPI004024BACF